MKTQNNNLLFNIIFTFVLITIILTSYQVNNSSKLSRNINAEDETILYSNVNQEMFSYDENEKDIVNLNNEDYLIQYGFNKINSNCCNDSNFDVPL
ncbi:MAG: hypothetical protein ACRCZK_05015 [Oscillospiraceae bacterium]